MTTIHTFPTDTLVVAQLINGPGGALYGTTYTSGTSVLKITTKGKLTTLHVFGAADDGFPAGPLLLGRDDVLYGMTSNGGPGSNGTVFSLTPDGRFRTLYGFGPAVNPFDIPVGGLIQDSHGNLYGEMQGQIDDDGDETPGAVFKLTPKGTLTTLYSFSFTHPLNGAFPSGGLTWGRDGNLYGVTLYGGTFDWGTIFRITPTGQMTIIYNFTGGADGGVPITGLTLASNGDFYGTTSEGGSGFSGTVFRFKPPPVDCRDQ